MIAVSLVFSCWIRKAGAPEVAVQAPRRKTEQSEWRFGLSSAEQLAAGKIALSEKTVAEEAGSGKDAGFAEDTQ